MQNKSPWSSHHTAIRIADADAAADKRMAWKVTQLVAVEDGATPSENGPFLMTLTATHLSYGQLLPKRSEQTPFHTLHPCGRSGFEHRSHRPEQPRCLPPGAALHRLRPAAKKGGFPGCRLEGPGQAQELPPACEPEASTQLSKFTPPPEDPSVHVNQISTTPQMDQGVNKEVAEHAGTRAYDRCPTSDTNNL